MTRRIGMMFLALALLQCDQQREATTGAPAGEPAANEAPAAPVTVDVGAQMPAYEAKLLDGTKFDITAERGNVLFLNLWATWCGPCRYEIPELEKLHKEHAARRFKVVGVSVDEGGDQVVRDFVNEQK